ncbi:MAG: BlaI/MecI/CopY family transcriptional regulator [Planctomycetaceae bacterium]|nr:BlaI/MecI/CopY family transcriptional regulator [Planctomycetaceae bacterium]
MSPSKKKSKLSTQTTKLTPGEAELLGLFWQHGPLTLSQAHEIYTGGSGTPALQTIQTRMNRMVTKKLLRREGSFPAVYSSAIDREKTRGRYFDLIGELAGDDLAPLMMHLSEKRSLTPEEIDVLEKIVRQQRAKNPNTKNRER